MSRGCKATYAPLEASRSPVEMTNSSDSLCCARGFGDFDAVGDVAVENLGDLGAFVHHFYELFGVDGLGSVGEGFVGLVMDLDHEAVGSYGDCGAGQGHDLVALAGSVAGIDEDGQVAEAVDGGHEAEVEGVAGVVDEGADPRSQRMTW